MKTFTQQFVITDNILFKEKMLNWVNQFGIFCFLDSCDFDKNHQQFEWILAASAKEELAITDVSSFLELDSFLKKQSAPVYGHFSYDLKNIMAGNVDAASDGFGFGYFFVPAILIQFKNNTITITAEEDNIFNQINEYTVDDRKSIVDDSLQPLQGKEEYLAAIIKIKQHIQEGDCYELNYCMKYAGSVQQFNVVNAYLELTKISPVPFASLYKKEGLYCMCASPERYIKIDGDTIISQPIKGTAKRYAGDELQDAMDKLALYESIKDRTENVMTVDLVRNDLSRICEAGSVKVSELFGIYSFATVHQMISTVQGKVKNDTSIVEIIQATFPMASMTGAPKKKVMELIDESETNGRGLFSGSIGYISPNGNADFNVVIRSIFYDEDSKKIWSYAGGAITHKSEPEAEWEECNLKMAAVRKSLGREL